MSGVPVAVDGTAARAAAHARVLLAFVGSGLAFMLVPGTFLGVMNLIRISGRESVALVSPAWIQAHGHAQVFGWIGSFMLGIGFYSAPGRAGRTPDLRRAWACWTMWTAGVALRWLANVYGWQWRLLLPVSAALELAAFLVFLRVVSRHRVAAGESSTTGVWMWAVIAGTVGWVVTLVLNLAAVLSLSWRGVSPALPHVFDQHFLTLLTWGVLAPFLWGFSARWMPVLLGLDAARRAPLVAAVAAAVAGIGLTFAGVGGPATGVFILAAGLAIVSLHMFEPASRAAKTRGVHPSSRRSCGSRTSGCSSPRAWRPPRPDGTRPAESGARPVMPLRSGSRPRWSSSWASGCCRPLSASGSCGVPGSCSWGWCC